ncbi:MAG: VanZ family protein [Pleurocapsa sp.]
MKKKQSFIKSSNWLAYLLAIASFLCIVIATIYPFKFVVPENVSLEAIFSQFKNTSDLQDYANNILLFMPWGFSLAWILRHQKLPYFGILIITIIASFSLSLSVEIIQAFLPIRVSNFADVTTNTIGGGIGACVYWCRRPIANFFSIIISQNYDQLTPKTVGLTLVGYFAFINLIIASLLLNVNLNNWENSFPLIIGNEVTENRPWEGRISQLHISDRSLSKAEIETAFNEGELFWLQSGFSIASYLFSGENIPQTTKFVNLVDSEPTLVWQQQSLEQSVANSVDQSITLNRDRWLKTPQSASTINYKLKQTNQFTLSAVFATNNTEQSNDSRIISISSNTSNRNFTIAQKQKKLMLRLRTPVTGENGNRPELLIPNVFNNLGFHHLIMTFDANQLDIYLDHPSNQYTFAFEPETTFWSYFPPVIPLWQVNLKNSNKLLYYLGFYTVLFIPLGFLGGILLSFLNRQKYLQLLLLSIICLLPALLIEQLYVTLTTRPMRTINLLISIAVLSLTTLAFKNLVSSRRQPQLNN